HTATPKAQMALLHMTASLSHNCREGIEADATPAGGRCQAREPSSMVGQVTMLLLEKPGLAAGKFAAKVFVRARSGDAAARSAVDHADLHEVRLGHFFHGVFFFSQRGG